MSFKPFFAVCLLATLAAPAAGQAAPEPALTIQAPGKTVRFTLTQLLARKDLAELAVTDSPDYPGQTFRVVAVPATALFAGLTVAPDSEIQFKCLDGFSAPLSPSRLLSRDPRGAIAYVAIEPPRKPWPKMKKNRQSPGPFYLVWRTTPASRIGSEEWPYQLAGFELKPSFAVSYPRVVPAAKLAADSPERRGFAVFRQNCFACHTLNGQGESAIGPDLNAPMGPSEYFGEDTLKKLIRNPQSVRHWPQSRMPGFGPERISDAELADLVAFLKHKAETRHAQ